LKDEAAPGEAWSESAVLRRRMGAGAAGGLGSRLLANPTRADVEAQDAAL